MVTTAFDTDRRKKAAISAPRRQLVEMMHELRFGLIEDMVIRNGEPVFDPAPRILRDIKLGATDTSRSELAAVDFELKTQTVELFGHLQELGHGTVECLEVRGGLPFRVLVRQQVPCQGNSKS